MQFPTVRDSLPTLSPSLVTFVFAFRCLSFSLSLLVSSIDRSNLRHRAQFPLPMFHPDVEPDALTELCHAQLLSRIDHELRKVRLICPTLSLDRWTGQQTTRSRTEQSDRGETEGTCEDRRRESGDHRSGSTGRSRCSDACSRSGDDSEKLRIDTGGSETTIGFVSATRGRLSEANSFISR